LTSKNGFAGTINLSTSGATPHVKENISPNSVTITSNGSATAILMVKSDHKVRPGTYSITVTAVSGTITHQITVSLTIT
jgi:uncharacterized membrane protein